MSDHRPDRDALTGYLDDTLSIDARQWMEHHLERCSVCRAALEQERGLSKRLDSIRGIEPPADFTEGVMARVAQQPPHQPSQQVPWRRVAMWTSGVASSLAAVLLVGAWLLWNSGALQGVSPTSLLSRSVRAGAGYASELATGLEDVLPVVQALGKPVMYLFELATNAGWAVQLAVLLITVTLNYVLTRMVLNYQRRH